MEGSSSRLFENGRTFFFQIIQECGNLGFCNARTLNPCKCLQGCRPLDGVSWDSGDFSGGCHRESNDVCCENDVFEVVGPVNYDGAIVDDLYLRVQKGIITEKNKEKTLVLIGTICGFLVVLMLHVEILLGWRKMRIKKTKREEEEGVFSVTNLKVFTYKELHVATRGFSEKLGHGGFGAVLRGKLSDSSIVAVKRLERPGGGEREFRAEVCTIGNIQHVNLVRLRGFCSENSHRLLVYDYMPNGPLSVYLKKDGQSLSWDVRFRVAMGTVRGIAYLHEECRNCIIQSGNQR
ncbi:unnamed protein product [Ilex paraguariensis]|uniref:non-specific serine/threonine protein kinase n=1 Tax=Ilex paraguariensis TaxID=185542 RepID=A0ABC8REY8_9AQUA